MSDFLSQILQWINDNPHWAGFATFVISAAESVAIIGTIVPGTVMMTAIGALAGAGVMPLWSTIIWAILGAIVGDGISYWIGYYFKDRMHYVWPFRTHPNILASGERFFHKHGGKSVFIGRFVGPVRALVPLIAGMLHMKPWRFAVANITSAIGWAPAYMLPGIVMGAASLELPPDIAVHAILMLLLLALFVILCLWIIRKVFFLVSGNINHGLNNLWHRLQTSRYFSPITRILRHSDPQKTHGQLTLAFYLIVAVLFLIYLASYIAVHGPQDTFINSSLFYLARSIRTPQLDSIMLYVTLLGESRVLLPLAGTLFLLFAFQKRWLTAWHVLLLAGASVVCVEILKHVMHIPRPWGIFQSPSSGSFPSGHTTLATVFYLGLAYLLTEAFNGKFARFFFSIAAIIISAVAVSRIYLGAHWLTDVLGGLLLGAALLMLFLLSYNRTAEKPLYPKGILLTALLTLLVTYGVFSIVKYPTLKRNYAQIDWPVHTVSLNSWWTQQGENLPLFRINRFGLSSQVLNVQWIGNLEEIKSLLVKNGWQTPPERNWITVLHRISDVQSAEHLPLVSPLYLDKEPVLVMIKHTNGNKKLVVLRLWNSNLVVKNVQQPLWVGVVETVPRTYSWLFKRKKNGFKFSYSQLFATTPKQFNIKTYTVKNKNLRSEEQIVLIKPN